MVCVLIMMAFMIALFVIVFMLMVRVTFGGHGLCFGDHAQGEQAQGFSERAHCFCEQAHYHGRLIMVGVLIVSVSRLIVTGLLS